MKTFLKLVPLFALAIVALWPVETNPVDAQGAPKGEKTADGMRYKLPSVFGTGHVTFSREAGYLRVDVETLLPYDDGDGLKYQGSATELILSVNGSNGRRLAFFPSPVWQPGPNLPSLRVEVAYDKGSEPRRVTDPPSFAATGNVKFWDRYQTTFWVNLARVITADNAPDKVSNNWKIGLVTGTTVATSVFPEGLDVVAPDNKPDVMLTLKINELPERPKPRADPFNAAVQRETNYLNDLKRGAQQLQNKQYKAGFDVFKDLCRVYPEHLAPKYICWLLPTRIPAYIKDDPLPLLKDYVEACPSQLNIVNEYLTALMGANKDQDAMTFYTTVSTSPLVSVPARKAELEINWANLLIDNGYAAKAEPMIGPLLNNDVVKKDDIHRVRAKLLKARLCEARGDSKGAAAEYAAILDQEKAALIRGEEKTPMANYCENMRQWHDLAATSWAEEMNIRAEDEKNKTKHPRVTLDTTKGKVVIELYQDDAPNTVASIVKLVQKKFYDGLSFHNYLPTYMVQGGCPKGDGSGFPGYRLAFEGPPNNRRNFYRGVVGMAALAPNTDTQGSQFFICTQNTGAVLGLGGKYVAVGRVIEGIEIVDMLRKGDKIKSAKVDNLRDGTEYEPETKPE